LTPRDRDRDWRGNSGDAEQGIAMTKRRLGMAAMGRHRGRRLLAASVAAAIAGAGAAAHAQSNAARPEQLIGIWRGTSLCTDRVAAPACHDETVVYEFTAGSQPGTVHWMADKVVNGQRERMGELELTFDETGPCWKAEFSSPRVRSVWCLVVEGTRLQGTARLVPGDEVVRKVDLRRMEDRDAG
jgi:hypothetical protein